MAEKLMEKFCHGKLFIAGITFAAMPVLVISCVHVLYTAEYDMGIG